jgi:hypothetical protein
LGGIGYAAWEVQGRRARCRVGWLGYRVGGLGVGYVSWGMG